MHSLAPSEQAPPSIVARSDYAFPYGPPSQHNGQSGLPSRAASLQFQLQSQQKGGMPEGAVRHSGAGSQQGERGSGHMVPGGPVGDGAPDDEDQRYRIFLNNEERRQRAFDEAEDRRRFESDVRRRTIDVIS